MYCVMLVCWCIGKGVGLVVNRLPVRFPAVPCTAGLVLGRVTACGQVNHQLCSQSSRSTQPSIFWRRQIKYWLIIYAGVKVGCVHLCWVAGNTVWSHYGKWQFVAVRQSSKNSCTFTFFNLYCTDACQLVIMLLSITVITSEYDVMSWFCAQLTLFHSAILMQQMGDASLRPLAQHR